MEPSILSGTGAEARTMRLLATATAAIEELTERCAAAESRVKIAEDARFLAEQDIAKATTKSCERVRRLEALVAELRSALRVVAADLADVTEANAVLAQTAVAPYELEDPLDRNDEVSDAQLSGRVNVPALRQVLDDAAGAAGESKTRMVLLHDRLMGGAPTVAARAVA